MQQEIIEELSNKIISLENENKRLTDYIEHTNAISCCYCNKYTSQSECSFCYTCKKRQCQECKEIEFICANKLCKNSYYDNKYKEYYCRSSNKFVCCECIINDVNEAKI